MCGCVRKLRFSRIYNNLLRTLMLIIFGFANINNGLTSDIHKDKLDDTLQQHQIDNQNQQQQQEHHNKIINQNLIMSHISNLDTNNDDNIMPKIRQYNNNLKETEILNNNNNKNGASNIGGGTNSATSSGSSSSSSSIIIGSNSGSNISGRISGSSSGNSNSRNDKNIIINNSNSQIINENIIDNLNTELNNNNNNNNFNNMDNNKQTDSSMLDDIYNTPMYFGTDNATVVTTQIGATAHMPCTIHHIGDGVVSWIRRKDYHLLTVGLTTYNSDERFSATHLKHSEDWTLQIKFVQLRDAGIYECQVSTHPPTSIFLHLSVVEARAEISGPPIRYLTPGSTLRLQCRVLQNTQPSEFIFWYHDNRMINYDIDRGINVSTETDFQSSELVILKTRREHSGNFTCLASNAQPASVLVHIFKGDNPAAMYHGHVGSSNKSYQNQLLIKLLLIFSITKTFLCHNSFSPLNIIKSV